MARYLFLFDKVVIVCKRKGYSYELKEVIELLFHKMTDDPMHNKDIKKVGLGLQRGRCWVPTLGCQWDLPWSLWLAGSSHGGLSTPLGLQEAEGEALHRAPARA